MEENRHHYNKKRANNASTDQAEVNANGTLTTTGGRVHLSLYGTIHNQPTTLTSKHNQHSQLRSAINKRDQHQATHTHHQQALCLPPINPVLPSLAKRKGIVTLKKRRGNTC